MGRNKFVYNRSSRNHHGAGRSPMPQLFLNPIHAGLVANRPLDAALRNSLTLRGGRN